MYKRQVLTRLTLAGSLYLVLVCLLPEVMRTEPVSYTHLDVYKRQGYRYHGRIKALADAAREAGLQF